MVNANGQQLMLPIRDSEGMVRAFAIVHAWGWRYTSNPPWQASRPNLVTLPTRRHLGGESKSPRGLKRFAYSVVCNGLPKQFYLSDSLM